MKRKTAVLRLPAHPMTCVPELPAGAAHAFLGNLVMWSQQ